MKTFDVIGFGALNVDKLYRVNRIAGKEEESFVTSFTESCGGSAANTVVGLAKLGLKTGYIGKVAEDREGKLLFDDFKKEGVDTEGVIVAKHGRSGVAMGYVDPKGERALYVDPGVNDTIKFNEINPEYISQTKFLHLTSFVGEKSFKAQKKLVRKLPENVKVSFDPGILYARKGFASLKPIIRRTFVMLPKDTELKLLTGKNYRKGAEVLIKNGVSVVVVKLGKKGCYVSNGKESHLVKPCHVRVVDTTGAGDAFSAGFLYGLIKGKDLRDCGKLGNFVASRCIEKVGARVGLPRLLDLREV
ncbi:MAG: carbohydrate kinase family protein [Thermoproteota archaeon]|nr:carbohydrate kinase family protein [Thermoproteota archaeon]